MQRSKSDRCLHLPEQRLNILNVSESNKLRSISHRLTQSSVTAALILLFILLGINRGWATPTDPLDNIIKLSPNAKVYLVTVGPGSLVWERFGHNGIWIQDPALGFDMVFHWGLFDFQSENFWPKFLQGYMDYSIGSIDSRQFFQFYAESKRGVQIQELNFSADQKNRLTGLLIKNDTEGQRIYRYNYYLDNCSTRARDILDQVLGGLISNATTGKGSGKSFRSNTQRLLQKIPGAYLGVQLALGAPADREISIWQDMFTPMSLRRHLNKINFSDGSPIVLSDKLVYAASSNKEPTQVTSYLFFYLPISASLALLFASLGYVSAAGKKWARVLLALGGSLWSLISALVGTLLLLIWGFTEHRYGHWNANLLQYNPLSFFSAIFFIMLMVQGQLPKKALLLLKIVTGLSLLGLVFKFIPIFEQGNGEAIALALPVHLGLLWGIYTAQTSLPPLARPSK